MSERQPPPGTSQRRPSGVSQLLELVVRPSPPPRPDGGLLADWYHESGAEIPFGDWCDPAARHLADVFASLAEAAAPATPAAPAEPAGPAAPADLATVEEAVVAFAQARAGSDHSAAEVVADLVALVRLAWPSAGHQWDGWMDPLGLLARALGAWAAERVAVASSVDCVDPATGLVTAKFLERRLDELHAQCDALAISAPMTFGSVVVRLGLGAIPAAERVGLRIAAGRILAERFRAGETVASLDNSRTASRMAAVMPAYGLDRAMADVRSDLTDMVRRENVELAVGRVPFGDDPRATFAALVHSMAG